jgi:FKBP12-rapamycin complex-associated protein
MALEKGFSLVKIEMWLVVLPQIIARIHSNNRIVRELIQELLVRIGKGHPQVCIFLLSLRSYGYDYYALLWRIL